MNLILLCKNCNPDKKARTISYGICSICGEQHTVSIYSKQEKDKLNPKQNTTSNDSNSSNETK
jgi:hypothetical protein